MGRGIHLSLPASPFLYPPTRLCHPEPCPRPRSRINSGAHHPPHRTNGPPYIRHHIHSVVMSSGTKWSRDICHPNTPLPTQRELPLRPDSVTNRTPFSMPSPDAVSTHVLPRAAASALSCKSTIATELAPIDAPRRVGQSRDAQQHSGRKGRLREMLAPKGDCCSEHPADPFHRITSSAILFILSILSKQNTSIAAPGRAHFNRSFPIRIRFALLASAPTSTRADISSHDI